MSDAGVGKGFVFVVIFLFVFAFLITIAPADLVGYIDNPPSVNEIPDQWIGDELLTWGEILENWGNQSLYLSEPIDITVGVDVLIRGVWINSEDRELYLKHRNYVIPNLIYYEHDIDPSPLTKTRVMQNIVDGSDPQTSRITMTCSSLENNRHGYTYFVSITYNATKFSSLEEAYDGNDTWFPEIRVFVGMGWESSVGSANAWNVIGQLLLFQSPDVGDVYINVIIGFSLWACIIYLGYALVTMIF